MNICDRHQEVICRLNDHEKRIRNLEINDAKMSEKIENLIEKLDNLAAWIRALVMLDIASLIGFFFLIYSKFKMNWEVNSVIIETFII